ncbi:unnamed protein product [Caenorhabditis brenneri]
MVTGRVFFPKMVYCGIKILEKTNLYKKYTVENSTKIFCSMDWFNSTMPLGCNIIDSGIWVVAPGNATEIEHFARALETVEYMMGPIVLRGTSIEKLLLPNLTTIYSMFYDLPLRSNGWGYQILQFTGNQNLTEISFPKLENIFHYSYEAFIRTSDNPVLKCSLDTCNKMLSLFRFELDSCSCGLIPTLNKGYSKLFLALTITEAVCCAVLVITALFAFIFCGFPQNLFNLLDDSEYSVKRTRKVFEYYYGSVIIRWHYLIYAIFLRMYMHDMLKKVNIRSDAVTTTKKSYNAVAPANPNRAAH